MHTGSGTVTQPNRPTTWACLAKPIFFISSISWAKSCLSFSLGESKKKQNELKIRSYQVDGYLLRISLQQEHGFCLSWRVFQALDRGCIPWPPFQKTPLPAGTLWQCTRWGSPSHSPPVHSPLDHSQWCGGTLWASYCQHHSAGKKSGLKHNLNTHAISKLFYLKKCMHCRIQR